MKHTDYLQNDFIQRSHDCKEARLFGKYTIASLISLFENNTPSQPLTRICRKWRTMRGTIQSTELLTPYDLIDLLTCMGHPTRIPIYDNNFLCPRLI